MNWKTSTNYPLMKDMILAAWSSNKKIRLDVEEPEAEKTKEDKSKVEKPEEGKAKADDKSLMVLISYITLKFKTT